MLLVTFCVPCSHHAKYYHTFSAYHRNKFMWLQNAFHASSEIQTNMVWIQLNFDWDIFFYRNEQKQPSKTNGKNKQLFSTLKNQTHQNQYFDAYWMNVEWRGRKPTWKHWWHCSNLLLALTRKSKQNKLHRRISLVKEMICFVHICDGKVNRNNSAKEEESVMVAAAAEGEHGNCGIYSQRFFVIFLVLLLRFLSFYVILWQRQKRSNQLEFIVSSQCERSSMKVIRSGITNVIIVIVVIAEREMLFLAIIVLFAVQIWSKCDWEKKTTSKNYNCICIFIWLLRLEWRA